MKLFLDDVRNPPEGFILFRDPVNFKDFLEHNWERIQEISLDHDLGFFDDNGKEITGYDVLTWIEQFHFVVKPVKFRILIHSANIVGVERMEAIKKNINEDNFF